MKDYKMSHVLLDEKRDFETIRTSAKNSVTSRDV